MVDFLICVAYCDRRHRTHRQKWKAGTEMVTGLEGKLPSSLVWLVDRVELVDWFVGDEAKH
jgi:hypothetical protein